MNFTNVPDSCSHSQPRSIASFTPAPYSAGEPPFIADVARSSWDARPRSVSLCEISPGLFPEFLLGFVRLMSALIG
jgi:hypothetical protein